MLQLVVNYNVILLPESMKFLEVDKSSAGSHLKYCFLCQEIRIKKDLSLIMTSSTPYDTYHGAVINHVACKCTVCMYRSFGGVKAHGHTPRENHAIYMV